MISAPAKFYSYAVIDTSTTPTVLVAVALTRQLARRSMDELMRPSVQPPFTGLKVRRAKLTLFET